VNAAKGVHNRLRGRVRNIGPTPEVGATVLFRYAPIYIGLPDSALKTIAMPMVDFAAAGDPSGNDLKVVPADWDLTNLTDTNGGIWPMPISAFDHFCVKVDIESSDDINLANNQAQTNFADVANAAGMGLSFLLLVGNPFDQTINAQVEIGQLPAGYAASFQLLHHHPSSSVVSVEGETLTLNPGEIRVASLTLTRPASFMHERRTADVVADVSMVVGGQPVGGLSVRLAKANTHLTPPAPVAHPHLLVAAHGHVPAAHPGQPPHVFAETLTVDLATAVDAAAALLRRLNLPVALADPTRGLRGLVSSGSVPLDARELRQLVPARFLANMPPDGEGRYLVSFLVESIAQAQSRVTVSVMIILGNPDVDSMLGGALVPSNGALETRYLQLLAQEVGGPR
jgi:hypothetical protein